jgi:CHAT domain-containing protein/Tfp pilus assembly protein PilF
MTCGFRPHYSLNRVVPVLCAFLCTVCTVPSNGRGAAAHRPAQSAVPQQPAEQNQIQSIPLEPGKAIERTLTGTEIHPYQLKMQKAQCAVIQVEQRGINIVLQLRATNSEPIVEVDDEIGKQGIEKLVVVAESDGTYKVEVKPKLKIASGSYEIRLLEVRPATGRDRSLFEADKLRTKVSKLSEVEKTEEALPLAEHALALAEAVLEPDDVYVALLTRELAAVNCRNGKYTECKAGMEQALQLFTAKLGTDHLQANITRRQLGGLYQTLGDLPKAEQLLSQALDGEQKVLGEDDPAVAATLNTLGFLHLRLGDYVKAESEFERVQTILENVGLKEEPRYGYALNNLGLVHLRQHQYDKALIDFERFLAFQEARLGPNNPIIYQVLSNLGVVAKKKGDYPTAEKFYLRALALGGPEGPDVTPTLSNLGNVYSCEGNFQKALETHQRVLRIVESNWNSPIDRRRELEAIAINYAALGDSANAHRVQAQMESGLESEIALNLAIGSERQKLLYLDTVASDLDDTISLHLRLQSSGPEAASLAATALLRRKGRVMDAMTDTLNALRTHSDPDDQALLDQLKEATAELAHLALEGPQKRPLAEYRKALEDQREKKEKIENAISHHNREVGESLQPITLEAVTSLIPEDSALVEFVTYKPSNPKAASTPEQYEEPRYAAYVLHKGTSPMGVDLGDARIIDALVAELRSALREPDRSDVQALARQLAEKVFQPLEPLVASDKRLLISPDGQLNLIPFEALREVGGGYLVERFSITYLSSGRDLVHMQVKRPSSSVSILVADPLFGEPNENLVANAATPQAKPARARIGRRSITTGADFSNLYFAPLAGTRAEAQSIHSLFPDAQELIGEQASRAALEKLNGPKILHIATHGFFLQDTNQGKAGGNAASNPENPLLRSGLALSGANLSSDSKGRGILTALQASNMDLWGTKLVTLSACDTGVGEVKNGEGVYGLRRAFFLAGTESLVMSLWPVSDYVTRQLMTQYYAGLKKGLGRGEALRQAQLAMLKRKGRQHPFYWASFIQSGEWANLDGQR